MTGGVDGTEQLTHNSKVCKVGNSHVHAPGLWQALLTSTPMEANGLVAATTPTGTYVTLSHSHMIQDTADEVWAEP